MTATIAEASKDFLGLQRTLSKNFVESVSSIASLTSSRQHSLSVDYE